MTEAANTRALELHTPITCYKAVPYDILFTIFEHIGSIDPRVLSNDTLYDRDTSWKNVISSRKAVVQVCREWWEAGIPHLYKDVYLHRIGQLAALRRTLEKRRSCGTELGRFVSNLITDFYVPRGWECVYKQDLGKVLKMFPNIKSIMSNPAFDFVVTQLGSKTKYLEIETFSFSDILSSLKDKGALRNLSSLSLGCRNKNDDFWTQAPTISFLSKLSNLEITLQVPHEYEFDLELPSLQSLTCTIPFHFDQKSLDNIGKWSLPSLSRLTIMGNQEGCDHQFLGAFGKQLKFFGYGDLRGVPSLLNCRFNDMEVEQVLATTPNLEHLVIHQWSLGPISKAHPNLKRMDVLSPFSPRPGFAHTIRSKKLLPSLRTIGYPHYHPHGTQDLRVARRWRDAARTLGAALVDPDGKPIIVPDEDSDVNLPTIETSEGVTYTDEEMDHRYTYPDTEDEEGSETSDASYQNDDSWSTGSSEYWESDWLEEEEEEKVPQVNHETALSRFEYSLNASDLRNQDDLDEESGSKDDGPQLALEA